MKMDEHTDPNMDTPFAALRSAMQDVKAPRGVEKELMDAFARHFPPRRWYHALSPRQWGVAGGVGTTALVAVLAFGLSTQVPSPAPAPQDAVLASFDNGTPFIALESAERIEAETDPRMLETELPRTSLAALGVPVTPDNAGDSVRAELLVGADGSPLALRLALLP